jgi:hypothetical protein
VPSSVSVFTASYQVFRGNNNQKLLRRDGRVDVPSHYDVITVSGAQREIKITAQAHGYSLKDEFLTMN